MKKNLMSGFLREKRRGISPPLGGPGSFDQPMITLIISLIPIKARNTMKKALRGMSFNAIIFAFVSGSFHWKGVMTEGWLKNGVNHLDQIAEYAETKGE
ncbi:MAG: hypothetical protein IIZ61_01035 [Lachnospiraceae bacterium]|nr:hypothetical protein [Lachnospiraceae bacterium]